MLKTKTLLCSSMSMRQFSASLERVQSRRTEMDRIALKLGIETQGDWYKVTSKMASAHTPMISQYYRNSIFEALKSVYPEFEWTAVLSYHAPQQFWQERKNQRKAFDWIADQIGLEKQEDWYEISCNDLKEFRVYGILTSFHNTSPIKALRFVYPEFEWNPSLFKSSPKSLYKERMHQRRKMDEVAARLGISTQHDWYNISIQEAKSKGAETILRRYYNNSLWNALQRIYPEYEWNPLHCRSSPRNLGTLQYQTILQTLEEVTHWNSQFHSFRSIFGSGDERMMRSRLFGLRMLSESYFTRLWRHLSLASPSKSPNNFEDSHLHEYNRTTKRLVPVTS